MNQREDKLIRQMTGPSRKFYLWIAFLSAFVFLAVVAYAI